MSTNMLPPGHIGIPPVPPLMMSSEGSSSSDMVIDPSDRTNTLALLLPHLALFEPSVQDVLKEHYAQYGDIVHWAPVKGFGRVIIVYRSEDDAMVAKQKGDRLRLDLDLPDLPEPSNGRKSGSPTTAMSTGSSENSPVGQAGPSDPSYFGSRHRRRKSYQARKGITLRLHLLPPTPLNIIASEQYLKPPEHARNFLISPPGSPPEGWEPIVEDGPNTSTLAEDLQRALEHLELNWAASEGGRHSRRGSLGKMVVHDDGGVRVEVEDCTMPTVGHDDEEDEDMGEAAGSYRRSRSGSLDHGEQYLYDGQAFGLTSDGVMKENLSGGGLGSALRTRIAPTARPPLP